MKERKLTMEEIQSVSLEILKKISDVCESQNLRYFLAGGTLIGAVRHKGFIPWDDDLDVVMPRPDHDKLIEYLLNHKEETPNLDVFNPDTCNTYPYMLTRISDNRYHIVMENEQDYGLGVFIDIYPLEGLGDNKKNAERLCKKGNFYASCCFQSTRSHFAMEATKGLFRKTLKYPFYLFSKVLGKRYFQNKLRDLKMKCPKSFDESKYVGCATWTSIAEKAVFPKEWLDGFEVILFEHYNFRVPKGYDEMLHAIYGDYMKLPPEHERIGHHFYSMYQRI